MRHHKSLYRRLLIYALLVIPCGLFFSNSYAQKIKYKDLFILLNAKRYDEAEPYLKKFLANPKDADEPNANLQMGMMLQYQAEQLDLVNQTDEYNQKIDSALIYYEKSMTLIDDREVRKNDEYYEDFYRRDLRTGKMGVKLSDVQLDIEKRIADLSTRSGRINSMKKAYNRAKFFYGKCSSIFEALQREYDSYNNMLIRCQDGLADTLDSLAVLFDSTLVKQKKYYDLRESLEKYFKRPVVETVEIRDFRSEGGGDLNLEAELLRIWDYREWAASGIRILSEETCPLYDKLVSYDNRLEAVCTDITEQLTTADVGKLEEFETMNVLMKFDQDPFPFSLFNYRLKKIDYISTYNSLKQEGVLDTTNLAVKTEALKTLTETLEPVKFMLYNLENRDKNSDAKTYAKFIDIRFDDQEGYERYLFHQSEFVNKEEEKWNELSLIIEESKNWLLYENDSIFLGNPGQIPEDALAPGAYMTTVVIDTITDHLFVAGWHKTEDDSLQVFLAASDGTQKTDQLHRLRLENITDTTLNNVHFAARFNPLEKDMVALIYDTRAQDSTYQAVVAKVDSDNVIQWSNPLKLSWLPYTVAYIPEDSRFMIYYDMPGAETGSETSDDNAKTIVINKDGVIQEEVQ